MKARWLRPVAVLTAGALVALAGCGDDDEAGTTTTVETTTTTTTEATTTTTEAPTCVVDEVLAEVDATLELVGLGPGGEWTEAAEGVPFAERTVAPEAFRDDLGLDCAIERHQTTATGAERLLLAAWTGPRISFVVQATDPPSRPFEQTARFELLIAQPDGEYFAGPHRPNRDLRTIWAATMPDGESFVLFAHDYSAGAVAKTWQEGFETSGEDEFITLDSERYGIERLRAAGARNVSIAEMPEIGSPIGTIQFISPTGQLIVTRVAPLGMIDPTTEWHQRPVTSEEVEGVTVYLSVAGPPDDADILTYDIAHATFDCGEWTWHVQTGFGTPEELMDWVRSFLPTLDCSGH